MNEEKGMERITAKLRKFCVRARVFVECKGEDKSYNSQEACRKAVLQHIRKAKATIINTAFHNAKTLYTLSTNDMLDMALPGMWLVVEKLCVTAALVLGLSPTECYCSPRAMLAGHRGLQGVNEDLEDCQCDGRNARLSSLYRQKGRAALICRSWSGRRRSAPQLSGPDGSCAF
ncbi:hypothetical protein Baya_0864 [Bagarius yarrelli]|uniref:Uncharacterized protein n=1 Tax=Bagarius yarrelli TaxID=175774 RepID=A0A556TJH8_BAGYA|nr:hypothetical protein Baya_0864 [Bagarius yarrelli]